MKSLLATTVLIAAGALLAGCASYEQGLVLDSVGPAPVQSATLGSNGSLVVFSAFEVGADFTSTDPDRRKHTDYKIFSEDGKFLQNVHNDTRTILEEPVQVKLPAGTYRIVARSNGFGSVTVPVVIAANRMTTVHLEGGGSWSDGRKFNEKNAVLLADGQIVGWRATAETIPPP